MVISEQFVKNRIITWLGKNNWRCVEISEEGRHGVDIKAKHNKYPRYYYIETKGEPDKNVKHPSSRMEVNFVYALGQILLRMKTKSRNYYAIGLPKNYSKKVKSRLSSNICKKLNLHIFLVNSEGNIERLTWKNLK